MAGDRQAGSARAERGDPWTALRRARRRPFPPLRRRLAAGALAGALAACALPAHALAPLPAADPVPGVAGAREPPAQEGPAPAPPAGALPADAPGREPPPDAAGTEDAPLEPRAVEVEPVEPATTLPGLARQPETRQPHLTPTSGSTWLDTSRAALEGGIGSATVWLDRFFGVVQYLPLEEPSAYLRLRGEMAWREVGGWVFAGSVYAQVRMPALTRWARRLSVAFAGGGGGADEPRVASDPANPTFVPLPSVASPGGALELRYDLFRGHAALLDVGAGARLKWPPVPYVRLRWLQAARVSHPLLLRLAPSAFWELDRGLGLRVELETHVALFSATVWKTRLSDAFTQLGPGLEWYAETGIQQLLDWRTVLYPAVAAAGATTALSSVGLSRIFVRARRDLYREWIYLELEPEVAWRADPSGQRLRSFGVILRLEVQLASLGTGSRWGP